MRKRSANYYEKKKKRRRQKTINQICYTSLISLLSITSILYIFLIVDKITETIILKDAYDEITTLKKEITSLDGKHDKIVKTLESNKKIKEQNDKLSKNIKKYQNNIEELEIQISKMEK